MRKTLILAITILTAIISFFQDQFSLSINAAAVGATALAVIVYIFGEFKNDIQRVKLKLFQEGKWKDPAFWIAFLSSILPVLNAELKLNLPVELIISVLTGVITIIFAKRNKELKNT